MKKIIAMIVIVLFLIPTHTAFAGYVLDSNWNYTLSPDSYTEDGKIKVYCLFDRIEPKPKLSMELPKIDISLPDLIFYGADEKKVEGTVTYPNRNEISPGRFDLQWVFTPDDDKYETISGILDFEVWPEDSEASKGKMPDREEEPEQPTTPSLTAKSVTLNTKTAYDINLIDKVSGSNYRWTSSDTDVVEVNSKSGLLKAKGEGKADVTCEITLPDKTKKTLVSEVVVGYDENAPLLTETVLDLNPGDAFDINLENKIAKSKYRWVSSDRSIVTVNSANGIVTAKSTGTAYVTCTITTPENQVIVLRCDINITDPVEIIE